MVWLKILNIQYFILPYSELQPGVTKSLKHARLASLGEDCAKRAFSFPQTDIRGSHFLTVSEQVPSNTFTNVLIGLNVLKK